MNICTIIAKNYVAHARVLAESFRAVDPEGICSVLIIDDFDGYLDPADEPFEVVRIDQIGLPDPEQMAASYDVVEFSTAVKPWFLRYLLERPGAEAITYLDPDIWVASSLAEIDRRAREQDIVLTPHFTSPLPRDGLKPSDEDILIAGTYNLGFIALGAGETASSLLQWWSERLERHCVIDPESGYFVDQRWIDLVPGLWPDLHVLRDPGFNVAYWNLPARRFELDGDRYRVDGEPLRFFHFSGFDPRKPGVLSRHQNRIDVSRSEALARVCAEYAAALLEHGYSEAKEWPYGWDVLPNGVRLDRPARLLHRQAVEEKAIEGSIFSRRGAKRFAKYATGSSGNGSATRYARAVHESRADLQQAFPDIEGRDGPDFARWMREQASGVSAQLLAPAVPATANGGARTDAPKGKAALGVNLAGYLSSELGVGEAARQVLSALEACQVPAATIDVPVDSSLMPAALGGLGKSDLPFEFNLICVNADMLPELAGAASPELLAGRHSAGLWFWEVSQFPERWQGSFDHLDEVWVASEHVAEAIRPQSPVPVNTVRIPVTPAPAAALSRAELGLPEGFCFLFVFDYRSVFRRKNPLGIAEAFRSAFPPGSGASLVIKSVSAADFPAEAEALAAAATAHPDIHLIEETVDPEVKNAMIQSCDCYVSLHRSEGLGLTMAEAMYFERPVIATAYSGNLDFMTEENSYLVGHSMTKIGPGAGPYPPEAEWAEPDLEQAASLMREVFEQPDAAATRGRRAAADIRRTHSPRAAGERIAARVGEARRRRVLARFETAAADGESEREDERVAALVPAAPAALAPAGDPASGQAQLHHLLRFGDPPPRRGAGRLRAFFKRLYMRLLRPYASHQQRINLSTATAIDELGTMLRQLEARSGSADDELRSHLDGELATVRARLDSVKADTRKALELPQVVEKRTAALRRSIGETETGLSTALERLDEVESTAARRERERDERESAREREREERESARERERDERDSGREREREEREARIRRAAGAIDTRLTTVDAEHTATRKWLGSLASDIDATFNRDRAAVEDLRSTQARLSAEIEAALAALREANASPYMAEERFKARTHPLLGEVVGFETGAEGSASDGYRGFEDLFRGPEEMIRDRQATYLGLVAGFAPVLDAGCGRGEFLDLLSEHGVEYTGVDLDPGMVARCRQKGHEGVAEADLLDHLQGLGADSLGTVFSAQVIEHLDLEQLQRLLELSLTRLRPGGLFIAETVNPHSPAALKAFWVDPSHRQPLFPETMLALCQLAGYAAADVFCPQGSGEWEADRVSQGEYAIVAVAPERGRSAEQAGAPAS